MKCLRVMLETPRKSCPTEADFQVICKLARPHSSRNVPINARIGHAEYQTGISPVTYQDLALYQTWYTISRGTSA